MGVWKHATTFIGFFSAGYVFQDRIYSIGVISGKSMQPELNEYNQGSDIVLVDRFSVTKPTFTKPERGDVVIFRSPEDARKTCVKRVVGVEGDSVIPRAGGKIHYYDRSEDPFQDEHVPVYIPKGYCWVEGDNAPFSKDSNAYGAIPVALIIGKPTHVLYPDYKVITHKLVDSGRLIKSNKFDTPEFKKINKHVP